MSGLYAGGMIFDGTNTPIQGNAVLVQGQRIDKVAPVDEFDSFSVQRVETTGGTLMPGLFDCHVHLCYDGAADPFTAMSKVDDAHIVIRAFCHAQAALRGGVTTTRDCGGKDYLEFAVRDACNNGELLGPTIRAAGRMICMTGGHGNRMGRVADGTDEVVKAVREQIHAAVSYTHLRAHET